MDLPFRKRATPRRQALSVQIRIQLPKSCEFFYLNGFGWPTDAPGGNHIYLDVTPDEAANCAGWLQRILHPRKRDKNGRFCK